MAVCVQKVMSCHLGINIETMEPTELDKTLTQFYAEVKKKRWTVLRAWVAPYHAECHWTTSRRQKRSIEHQPVARISQISTNSQRKGNFAAKKKKGETPQQGTANNLWGRVIPLDKNQLGDHNGRALTNTNFTKNLTEKLGHRGRQEQTNFTRCY